MIIVGINYLRSPLLERDGQDSASRSLCLTLLICDSSSLTSVHILPQEHVSWMSNEELNQP